MLPNSNDREGTLFSFCMIKDIHTWVIIEKTAFPKNAKKAKNITGFSTDCLFATDEKSSCPLRLMISAEKNIGVQLLKAVGEE